MVPTSDGYVIYIRFSVAVGTLERGNAFLQGLDFACGSVEQEGWQLRPAIQGGHQVGSFPKGF